ncbi:LamG-like jellyroll fold domain-containing protein [Streptomyces sp. BH097]|uniref:LamG-like jellyroll fold domain-containing protein n=1 Tax=unclassified Streptomyces TaxID=2593676 RepID=UPI003BB649C3
MGLLVEMGWGGLVLDPSTITWTDITQCVDVKNQGVAITRGASDELSETQPGTATLTLNNEDGRFTPGNSGSPYYPFVRRNAPIRVSVAVIPQRTGSAPYPLAQLGDDFDDNRISSTLWPNSYGGALEVGGRARVPVTPGGFSAYQTARQWTLAGSKFTVKLATLPAAGGSSSAAVSIMANSTTDGTRAGFTYNPVAGTLRLVSETGYFDGAATQLTFSAINHMWLRLREAAGTLYWETSGDGFNWTTRRTLATPAWVSAQQLVVEMIGNRTGGTGDYVEFDLVGATIRPRFYGTVNEWPIEWEGLYSKVTITATDMFKRFNKLPSLRSMVGEEIIVGQPLLYYPLTEDSAATSAGDLSGTAAPALPVTQAGAAGSGTLALGSTEGPAETGEQLAVFTPVSATAGKYLTADLGPQFQDRMGNYLAFEAWIQTTTANRVILGMHRTDLSYQLVMSLNATGGLQFEMISDGFTTTVTPAGPANLADGKWHHVAYDERSHTLRIDGTVTDTSSFVVSVHDMRVLHIGGYRGARLFNGNIGHVAMFTSDSIGFGPSQASRYDAGMNGHAGESADTRMLRLAYYVGLLDITVWGSTHDPMASQGPAGSTAMARMREVEATESGRLFAERDWYGLAYQSRDIRYNPSPGAETFTIDYADLEPGISLADDDQKMVNIVDATRPGGATQRVTASQSVAAFGEYSQDMNILKTSDNSVLDAAYWLVSRYANPTPELREVPIEAFTLPYYLDVLDAEIGSYFSVYNLPAQAPALSMRVTVEGYSEVIKHNSHVITFHTSASATDSVWILDDPDYSQLDQTTRLAY